MGQANWVQARYAGGEPMDFAKLRIIDPQGRTHQAGNADAQGRFAWLADQEGEWKVVVVDGMGHRGEVALPAGPSATTNQEAARENQGSQPMWTRIMLGLSVIFWASGLLFWWKGRPETKHQG